MRNDRVTRRAVVASAALVPLATLKTAAATADSVLSSAQRRKLEAFIDRLVPKDENGPSASECGAANYIDAQLGGFLAAEKTAFLAGLDAIDAGFADLAPEQQDAAVHQAETKSRAWFERVRRLTLEGMFSDPHYGGNTNYAGWELIRYPGPRLAVGEDEQKIKTAIRPVRMSAYGGAHGH